MIAWKKEANKQFELNGTGLCLASRLFVFAGVLQKQ
jgi:hypothetical protein